LDAAGLLREWVSQEPLARFAAPASECPRIGADLLAREKRRMTNAYHRQEFEREFVDPDDALFPIHLLNRAVADDEWLVFYEGAGEQAPLLHRF